MRDYTTVFSRGVLQGCFDVKTTGKTCLKTLCFQESSARHPHQYIIPGLRDLLTQTAFCAALETSQFGGLTLNCQNITGDFANAKHAMHI